MGFRCKLHASGHITALCDLHPLPLPGPMEGFSFSGPPSTDNSFFPGFHLQCLGKVGHTVQQRATFSFTDKTPVMV
jgi:hypothetical protein